MPTDTEEAPNSLGRLTRPDFGSRALPTKEPREGFMVEAAGEGGPAGASPPAAAAAG